MPAVHLRTDAPLHTQLVAIARAEGRSLNQYLLSLVRSDIARRQRMANAAGLSRWATDAELAGALASAVAAPLSDVEQSYLPQEPSAAVAYAAARAAKRGKGGSKPAPTSGTAPPKQRTVTVTRAAATPAPAVRSAAPTQVLVSASEYDALLALRAKRAGKPAPARGASGGLHATVIATDAELAAIRGAK